MYICGQGILNSVSLQNKYVLDWTHRHLIQIAKKQKPKQRIKVVEMDSWITHNPTAI